jgi:hypothetical protein
MLVKTADLPSACVPRDIERYDSIQGDYKVADDMNAIGRGGEAQWAIQRGQSRRQR